MNEDFIDYGRIAKAQTFYRALGYDNIEVPWLVSLPSIAATLPPECRVFNTYAGALVGSGEQSLIELMIQGKMIPGKYQCATPCFRDEIEYNELTRISFFKVELMWYKPEDPKIAFETIVNDAFNCFFELSDVDEFSARQTAEGVDIDFDGIELGSYGVRQIKEGNHLWVYGTGLAEPRFTSTMRRHCQMVNDLKSKVVKSKVIKPEESE